MNDPINCPNCGRFMKWHCSPGLPGDGGYQEWYTCVCNEIECFPGKNSVLISSKKHKGREKRSYRSYPQTVTEKNDAA